MRQREARHYPQGFTLIETLVGIALFAIIGSGIFGIFTNLSRLNKVGQIKAAQAAVGKEYLEIARNLSYGDIGVSGGIPSGILPASQTVTRGVNQFNLRYTIRNIDDPFDGTIGGSPNDTSPADYKQVAVEVTCVNCGATTPPAAKFSTYMAPKNLESNTNNGALLIQVLNANGQPVAGANVHIANSQIIPPVNLNDTTNNNGILIIVDAPPGNESYHVVASKAGYSTDQTYSPTDPAVINPVKLDATVIAQQVTPLSLVIDKLSNLNVASINSSCAAVANVNFNLAGSKLIGTNPDVYKYRQDLSTGATGIKNLTAIEWDSYNLTLNDSTYESTGFIPLPPINLAPDSTQDVKIVVRAATPHSLLVIVKDGSTQLPLSGAAVRLTKSGYDQTLLTNRGYLRQSSWKKGPGQANFTDPQMYWSDDGNVEVSNQNYGIILKKVGSNYVSSGLLISSTFDTVSATNFSTIAWQPGDQPGGVGADPVKFQIATNNDNVTWNFIGPDGTGNTYYTTPGETINNLHNNQRYLRYKIMLATADTSKTPNVADIAVTYIATCTPPGQTFFTSLSSADYTLEVSLTGYQTSTTTVDMTPNWSQTIVNLMPL